jgi:hypothetical protein
MLIVLVDFIDFWRFVFFIKGIFDKILFLKNRHQKKKRKNAASPHSYLPFQSYNSAAKQTRARNEGLKRGSGTTPGTCGRQYYRLDLVPSRNVSSISISVRSQRLQNRGAGKEEAQERERDRCGVVIPESELVGRCRECENRRLLVRFFFPSSS